MAGNGTHDDERARRFREATLPFVDDAFAYASFLLVDRREAEAAVEACYARAFDEFQQRYGQAMKIRLLATLREICLAALARPGRGVATVHQPPLIQPAAIAGRSSALQKAMYALPVLLREAIVLRDVNDVGYADIAEITGQPMPAVMRRLVEARTSVLDTMRQAPETHRRDNDPVATTEKYCRQPAGLEPLISG